MLSGSSFQYPSSQNLSFISKPLFLFISFFFQVSPGAQHALYAELPEVKEEMQRDISSWIKKQAEKYEAQN